MIKCCGPRCERQVDRWTNEYHLEWLTVVQQAHEEQECDACSWYCLAEYARQRDHEELRKGKPKVPGPVGG